MTIRQILLSSLFGAALAATPVQAVEPMKPTDPPKPSDLEVLKPQIDDMKKDVKSLQEFRKNIEDEIFGKGDGKTTTNAGLIKKMSDLEEKLKSIEATMKRIDEKLTAMAKSSTSGFGPAPAVVSKSTVRIVNDYPVDMSLMINGKSHRLSPGEVKMVDVTPGSYTYELLSAGAQETKSAIKEGETVTLRIR